MSLLSVPFVKYMVFFRILQLDLWFVWFLSSKLTMCAKRKMPFRFGCFNENFYTRSCDLKLIPNSMFFSIGIVLLDSCEFYGSIIQ